MDAIVKYFESIDPVLAALLATTFTWLVTAMGASLVFFFKSMHRAVLDGMLGFTGGVMVAASFWSLLNPSIELSERMYPNMVWMPAAVGFLGGALFLFFLDKSLPHLHINFKESEKEGVKTQFHKTTLLVLAITLHNIPEGLAVGSYPGHRYWHTEFPRRICCSYAFEKDRGKSLQELLVWSVIRNCRAYSRGLWGVGCDLYGTYLAIRIGVCSGGHDFCCC